ncbi:MAG: GNAT family N-acetyltransferase [Alphaproteobacteria bacterium]|nr:GNAT family N-acetyltransferase [Alphaproteobacteria bacterium]
MIPTLHTEHLVLRAPTIDDAPALQRRFATWEVIQHLSTVVPWPYPEDGARDFLARGLLPEVAAGRRWAWALVPRDAPDDLAGLVEVRRETSAAGQRGLWLHPDFQGRGWMTEAVTAVQDHLLLELGWPRLEVVTAQRNARSARLKERTGGVRTGTSTLTLHTGEAVCDVWEITQARWRALREG